MGREGFFERRKEREGRRRVGRVKRVRERSSSEAVLATHGWCQFPGGGKFGGPMGESTDAH